MEGKHMVGGAAEWARGATLVGPTALASHCPAAPLQRRQQAHDGAGDQGPAEGSDACALGSVGRLGHALLCKRRRRQQQAAECQRRRGRGLRLRLLLLRPRLLLRPLLHQAPAATGRMRGVTGRALAVRDTRLGRMHGVRHRSTPASAEQPLHW